MIKVVSHPTVDEYQLNGTLHRPNGPAIIWKDGDWSWWLFGNGHRYYGPEDNDGDVVIHGMYIKNDRYCKN